MASDAIDRDLDYAAITAIRATRAFDDPIIVNERTKGWALSEDHDVIQKVPLARLHMAAEEPLDERIEFATWPETLAYFATCAMDERFLNRPFRKAYQYAFRRYLERWSKLDPDEQPDPLGTEPDLTDQLAEDIGTLRFAIKRDQDRHFLETKYDDLNVPAPPKTYWQTNRQRREDPDRPDELSASAMSNIVDGYVDADNPADR